MHGIEEGSLDKGCAEASDLLYTNLEIGTDKLIGGELYIPMSYN